MSIKSSWSVYKHTAPSGKVYIGITSRNPEYRWNHGKGYITNQHFYRSIQKYGWDNIKHEILFTSLTKEEAEAKEIELITLYHSSDPDFGYNISLGGNVASDETRRRLSVALKGKKAGVPSWAKGKHFTEEHKQKISASNKNKPKSKAHCQKLSEAKKGKYKSGANPDAKKIDMYDLDGDYICTYNCIRDALKELNAPLKSGHISLCAKGKKKSAYGFIWKYAEAGEAV